MSFTDNNAPSPPDGRLSPDVVNPPENEAATQLLTHPDVPLTGDPISLAASSPAPGPHFAQALPEDLRISWSWLHFATFALFGIVSFLAINGGITIYYLSLRHSPNQKDFERFVLSRPELSIGSMVLLYGLILFFLYVSLSVLRGSPFWRTLGWRAITRRDHAKPANPLLYFLGGCVLSVLVFAATAKIQPKEDLPIEEVFRFRGTALWFMAMAVLVAPLVEETVFRGYLYPFLAGKLSSLARYFGLAPGKALRAGTMAGILTTGTAFGLLHGAQLGWTWGLVSVLILVGVVFTFVRARTGTVFTSFLLHLGYNSMIALVTFVGTQGFTKIPTAH